MTGYHIAGALLIVVAALICAPSTYARVVTRRQRRAVNPETEAALAVIRAEETNPARLAGAQVPDHAPGLERALERMVAEKRHRSGGAA